MSITTRNIIIMVVAAVVGVALGFMYPSVGLLMLIPAVGFIAFVFMRNKSGEKASAEEQAAAMTMTPAAGKARIYVMRKAFVAGQQGMNVNIGPRLNSQFRTKHFVMAEVDPGTHIVEAHMSSQTKSSAVTHETIVAQGEVVLLDAKLKMGALQGTIDLTETRDPSEIQEKLRGLKLVLWKEFREPATASANG